MQTTVTTHADAGAPRFLHRKFEAPVLSEVFVVDDNLTSALEDLDSWQICLLSAPSGSGKTALMATWHDIFEARVGTEAFWLCLDEHDGDPVRFMRALMRSLARKEGRFDSLAADEDAGFPEDWETLAVDFINLSDEVFGTTLQAVIFIDNYSLATCDSLDETIAFLSKNLSRHVRLVLAGSYLPDAISDLTIELPAVEIEGQDIALSSDRLRELCQKLDLDYDGLLSQGLLTDVTWPIFPVLLKYSFAKAKEDADVACLMRGYCRRFFEKEVMAHVSEEERVFLIRSVLLETLSSDTFDFVLGITNSARILDGLSRRGLFVYFDRNDRAFHCDSYMRRYLLDELLEGHRNEIFELSDRASRWFGARGYREEQAKYIIATCDPLYIMGTVSGSAGLQMDAKDDDLLAYVLSKQADTFTDDAFLCWAAVWACISTGLVDEARDWLKTLYGMEDATGDPRAFAFADALCLALEGDRTGSLRVIKEVQEDDSRPLSRPFQCLLTHMEGENVERLGNVNEGKELYLRAYSLAERVDVPFYKLFDLYLLAQHHLYMGQYEDASAITRKALTMCAAGTSLYGGFLSVLAAIQVERYELAKADETLNDALLCVSASANADMYLDVQLTVARLERVRGNRIEAFETACEMVDSIEGKHIPRNMDRRAYALKMALGVELDEMSAIRSCEQAIDEFLDDSDVFRQVSCIFAKVRELWHLGFHDESFELLDKAETVIGACGSRYFAAQLAVLRASFYSESDNETRAMVELNTALDLAIRGGYRSIFLEGRTCIRELLLRLATSRQASLAFRNYAKEVLGLFDSSAAVDESIAIIQGGVQGYYALTEREREILAKLNSGMSRGEIALSLCVSQNTVKSHLKNIYSKLGVHTRSEAYKASVQEQRIAFDDEVS